MKISIITATYNSEATIVDTVKSLESQDYDNIEYIIVDGASKDKTLELCKAHSTKITTIISEPDKGIYDALNKGINAATGDYIGFLHSDDVFAYPEAISDLAKEITNNKSDAIYADLQYVKKSDLSDVVRLWISGSFHADKLNNGWMPPHPTFYMSRKLYQDKGGFDLGFSIAADYDSLLRYLKTENIKVSYLDKVTIKMRVGGASNRSLKSIIQKTAEDIRAMKKNNIFWPQALFMKNFTKIPQFFKR